MEVAIVHDISRQMAFVKSKPGWCGGSENPALRAEMGLQRRWRGRKSQETAPHFVHRG
jgi:hypothetical protein